MAIRLRLTIALLPYFIAVQGCVIVPDNAPYPALPSTKVIAVDARTQEPIPDAKVVVWQQRLNAYFPDGKLGKEKPPAIFVAGLDHASSIMLTEKEVHVYPFAAFGTAYYSHDAWVYKRGYEPAEYPGSSDVEKATVQLVPCAASEGERMLFELLSKKIVRQDWKGAAEASLRKQLE